MELVEDGYEAPDFLVDNPKHLKNVVEASFSTTSKGGENDNHLYLKISRVPQEPGVNLSSTEKVTSARRRSKKCKMAFSVVMKVIILTLLSILVFFSIRQNELLARGQSKRQSDLCKEGDDDRCISGGGDEKLSTPESLAVAYQTESCDLVQEYSNLRHYFTPAIYPDESDTGLIQLVTYQKMRADSGIRIQYNSNTVAHNGTAGCNRWFVKFNGAECSDPATIEMIDYSETPQLLRRNMDMDGLCYKIPEGMVSVEIWIDNCAGFKSSDGLTAWLGARQLTIMEILPLQSVKGSTSKPCPALPLFNFFYQTWNQSGDETVLPSTKILIMAAVYNKLANDSALRIKYQAPQSVLVEGSRLFFCARWFIELNGTRCNPEGNFLIHLHLPNITDYYKYHSRTRTLEAVCENNTPAGPVSVELKIERCHGDQNEPTHVKYGDLGRQSRLIIEEVRLGRSTYAILGTDGKRYRSLMTNLARFHWNHRQITVANGDIHNINYTKHFSSTALKLTSSGDHRIQSKGCARWYFKINGVECGNPGVIDAVAADLYPPNVHSPMQTTGYCYGLPAGDYRITYSIGGCPGYTIADASTGWGSPFMIFIEEVQLDFKKSCYGIPANCN